MKRRILAAVLGGLFTLVLASPASAAPKDAQGCENNKASQLDSYCNPDS